MASPTKDVRGGTGEPRIDAETLARDLAVRVRELKCLFGLSDIVERSGGSLDRVLRETAELLPPSWQYPEAACAQVRVGERVFESPGYVDSPWKQKADVLVHGRRVGTVEISYRSEMPAAEEGPFTAEERALLNAVAERLGRLVERLTAEAKLKEKEGELRARMTHFSRVNTMGEMASSIAHEVNQPLTAIANYAQACRRLVESGRAEGADVLDVLDRISREALRAGGIIQRLRTLVKRRPGRATECDLVALVREAGTLVAADARLHDVRLDLDLPDTAPVVKCDPIQVQQVLLNLARNGIDAMDGAHDARLAVRVRREAQELVVSVEDRGCGLREGTEEAIFDPFFTTKEGGMGMGLAISRSIVARHGGRLWCAPNPYLGTTFYFTLPLARTADDE